MYIILLKNGVNLSPISCWYGKPFLKLARRPPPPRNIHDFLDLGVFVTFSLYVLQSSGVFAYISQFYPFVDLRSLFPFLALLSIFRIYCFHNQRARGLLPMSFSACEKAILGIDHRSLAAGDLGQKVPFSNQTHILPFRVHSPNKSEILHSVFYPRFYAVTERGPSVSTQSGQ